MRLLIDGYNLIYAAGIVGPPARDGRGLARSRSALIRFIAEWLVPRRKASAVVVFDAAGAPPGLPAEMYVHGVHVRFARGYTDADELIEELIAADTAPRRLTVVSSDHRVQRAAKRRRARAVDSDAWYADALRARADRGGQAGAPPDESASRFTTDSAKPTVAPTDAEVQFWLDRILGDAAEDSAAEPDIGDVFPPGYADDVTDDG